MSLQKELDALKDNFKKQAPEEVQKVMAQATADLLHSGIVESAIKVGDTLPDFTLPNQDGEKVALKELLQKGPLLINVFRGVWCPYCSIELRALNRFLPELERRNITLIGLAPQLQPSASENKSKLSLNFDILIDQGNSYAEKLGLCFKLPAELIQIYKSFGIDLPAHNGDESWRLPMPARLLVNEEGRVIYADISPDYTIRPEPEAMLAALDN